MQKKPIIVTVSGASGNIAYSLLFSIAKGNMFGNDTKIILKLLEINPALEKLRGVVMELMDCAFPLLDSIIMTDDVDNAFKDSEYAILVGAFPRKKGMERGELLEKNAAIFAAQAKSINLHANKNIKILVVGNPANTNAYIVSRFIPDLDPKQITSMMRLDHNRALSQISIKSSLPISSLDKATVWGNHSPAMFADCSNLKAYNKSLFLPEDWLNKYLVPVVASRGAAIIEARGSSSSASAASAAVDHMRDWVLGHSSSWVSMGVVSDGSYAVPNGLVFGFPCICKNGTWSIVKDLGIDQSILNRSIEELLLERKMADKIINI